MQKLSENLLQNYQVRKTKKQKTEFIEMLISEIPDIKIEQGGIMNNRNIVIGDFDKARIIFSAHYDTCAALPFPNFITPKNLLITMLYNILIVIPFSIVTWLASALTSWLTNSFWISYFTSIIVLFGSIILVFFAGKANKHTANDNTSGVIAICELLATLSEEEKAKCAFVLFDNEENGLLGSAYFRKLHKKQLKNKLLINLDCVGDGNNIMFVLNRNAKKSHGEALKDAFGSIKDKNVLFGNSATTFYPSDQMGFPKSIAVAALKRNSVVGLYMNKIHTKHDIVCDMSNIDMLCGGFARFLKETN